MFPDLVYSEVVDSMFFALTNMGDFWQVLLTVYALFWLIDISSSIFLD